MFITLISITTIISTPVSGVLTNENQQSGNGLDAADHPSRLKSNNENLPDGHTKSKNSQVLLKTPKRITMQDSRKFKDGKVADEDSSDRSESIEYYVAGDEDYVSEDEGFTTQQIIKDTMVSNPIIDMNLADLRDGIEIIKDYDSENSTDKVEYADRATQTDENWSNNPLFKKILISDESVQENKTSLRKI